MLRHAIQRLAMAVPVMFGVLLVGFLLMQVVPTDPAIVRAGPTASAEVIDAIRRDLGLDQPLWVQFGLYLWRLAQGDLGVSIINNVPVSQELAATIGPTVKSASPCATAAIDGPPPLYGTWVASIFASEVNSSPPM